jgi:hypothetical protein
MPMRKSRFTEEQIAHALRQAETGTPVTEVCRVMGMTEQTYCRARRTRTDRAGSRTRIQWSYPVAHS